MERDKRDIGLTEAAHHDLSRLAAHGWFEDRSDIARFCLAYAIRSRVSEGSTSGVVTAWAAGNFDESGEIRAILSVMYPECSTPVRLMEHLIHEGLHLVLRRLDDDHTSIGPTDLLG